MEHLQTSKSEKKLSTNKVSVIFNFGTVVLCAVRLSVRKCTTLNSRGHKMGNFKSSKFCQLNWPEYIDQTQKTRAALTDIDVNCSGTQSNGRLYVQSHTAELTDKPIASPTGITLYAYCLYADWWLIYWHIQVFLYTSAASFEVRCSSWLKALHSRHRNAWIWQWVTTLRVWLIGPTSAVDRTAKIRHICQVAGGGGAWAKPAPGINDHVPTQCYAAKVRCRQRQLGLYYLILT